LLLENNSYYALSRKLVVSGTGLEVVQNKRRLFLVEENPGLSLSPSST
jgi:hypothetical protein